MQSFLRKALRFAARTLLVVGIVILAVYVFRAVSSRSMPALEVWHGAGPDERDLIDPPPADLAEFLERERAWLDAAYADLGSEAGRRFSRYAASGPSTPVRDGLNLNGSFVQRPDGAVRGGILLVHGLSDSPYHMRALADVFAGEGLLVFGLRLPGHGTTPGALTGVKWTDWYAAVSRAVGLLRAERAGADGPLYLGGFSTGGALVVRYALEQAQAGEADAGRIDGLFLFAPAMAVTPGAAIANWHGLLSWMPYFRQFAWFRIQPEYDPFKYNSFPKNAPDQIYRLTRANADLAEDVSDDPVARDRMPPMWVFQSTIDATIRAEALAEFYGRLAAEGSELYWFDVNRAFDPFFTEGVRNERLPALLDVPDGPGRVFVVRNRRNASGYDATVEVVDSEDPVRGGGAPAEVEEGPGTDTLHAWPEFVYALSHPAVPISPDDPVYGRESLLGGLRVHGEKGILVVPDADLPRLRYNPFFELMRARIVQAVRTAQSPESEESHVVAAQP